MAAYIEKEANQLLSFDICTIHTGAREMDTGVILVIFVGIFIINSLGIEPSKMTTLI